MRKIIYYVACSLDGFIAGLHDDVSLFAHSGPAVEQYQQDLQDFDTVLMGRHTYEFGYQFGLEPGQPAYPWMDHYIFSRHLDLDKVHPKVRIVPISLELVDELKAQPGKDIYLCGGGMLAAWLLENDRIDQVKVKLNPILLGAGTPLFGISEKALRMKLVEQISYPDGLLVLTYQL